MTGVLRIKKNSETNSSVSISRSALILAIVSVLIFTHFNSFSATYTWTNTAGGLWGTSNCWSPNAPVGGPPAGSDIVLQALASAANAIDQVPNISLNSIICTGNGTSWLTGANSNNTVTVVSSWIVPVNFTLGIGNSGGGNRLNWMLPSTSISVINGYVRFDAGNQNKKFELYGDLSVNATGCIYDPNPSGGSDFFFYAGATLRTQKPQGWTTTAATSAATINYSVAVCTGGSYSYNQGVNYEYNGIVDQITGQGLNLNTAANVTISNSPGKIVTMSGNTRIGGDLIINTNSTFNTAALTCYLGSTTDAGDLINNGTFTTTTGSLEFNGNAMQYARGSSTTIVNNLTINNTNGVVLSSPLQVKGALALTAGLLTTSTTNLLILLNGATAPVLTSASTSYVNGPVMAQKSTSGATTLNFPIGKSPDCRPVQLVVNHANTTQYNYLAESFNASAKALPYTKPASIDTVSGVHYYDVTRSNSAGVSQPSLDLSGNQTINLCFGSNDGVKNLTDLRVVKNTFSATTTWVDLTGGSTSGSITNGKITSAGFTSFSRFTLAGSAAGVNPLPITLVDFTGVCKQTSCQLDWITETEHNNSYFLIEKSTEMENWIPLAKLKGGGTSQTSRKYTYSDDAYSGTLNYYRLLQVDDNNKKTNLKSIAVTCNSFNNEDLVIYPNPATEMINLVLRNSSLNSSEVVIFNAMGKKVQEEKFILEKGVREYSLPLNLPPGYYTLQYYSNGTLATTKKIVVVK